MHECAQVRQLQISHVMNQFFGGHAEFSFSGFLFYVGVPKKQRVQSAAKATAASFLPGSHSRRRIGMTVFLKCFATLLLSSVLIFPVLAQTPPTSDPKASVGTEPSSTPPAQEPAPAPGPPTWSVGPIDFSGLVDGYYSFNSNHPASQVNQLYNFNDKTNQFSLNMAKLSLAHSPDPVGFQVDLGFGRAFEIFNRQPTERASDTFRFLEQAYLSIKPPKAKGLEVDFGKFVTSAGAEVIETNGNWNYSRSLLFALAIPYYHFGVRTSIPIGKYFTGGVQS